MVRGILKKYLRVKFELLIQIKKFTLKPQPIIFPRRESLRVIDFLHLASNVIDPLKQVVQVGRLLVVFFRVA